jgi:UDP-glucose 4-epimerase
VIARFASQALRGDPLTVHGDGKQTRCFTYVSDSVQGTLLAARRPEARGHVFNIGRDREISIHELAEQIRMMLDSRSPIMTVPYESAYSKGFEDARRRVPDVRKARDVLGFEATVPLEEGLRRTLAWCREHYAGTRARA